MRSVAAMLTVATFSSACAPSAAAQRTFAGTLDIALAEGAGCVFGEPTRRRAELVMGADAQSALLGLDDGHTVPLRVLGDILATNENSTGISIAALGSGVQLTLQAPGTELCTWTARLQMQDAPIGASHIANLFTRDRARATEAEAAALYDQGKPIEAAAIFERAEALRREALGDEHPLVLRNQVRGASALGRGGRYDDALLRMQHALDACERTLGPDAFDTLRARNSMAVVLWSSGKPRDGLPLVERAYAGLSERFGPRHIETLLAQANVGLLLYELGRLHEAVAHYERLMPAMAAVRGEAHPRTLDVMNNLALIYNDLGRTPAALDVLDRAYRISVTHLGEAHPDTLTTLLALGDAYGALARITEAHAAYQSAYEGLRRALGDDHLWTISARSGVAHMLVERGRHDEALALFDDLVPRAVRVLGRDHILAQRMVSRRGGAHADRGDYDAALRDFRAAHALQVEVLGADHIDALDTLSSIGRVQLQAGDAIAARATLASALAALERVSGTTHQTTLSTSVALAEASAALGQQSAAMAILDGMVGTVEALRADEALSRDARQAFFSQWSPGYKRLALLRTRTDPQGAFRIAELSKARGLLESMALRTADMAGILQPAEIAELSVLEERASELSHRAAQVTEVPEERVRLEAERSAVARETSHLRRELRRRHPRYAELSDVVLIDATQARALAQPREALISFVIAGDEAIAFVVRRDRPLRVVSLGKVVGLDDSVAAYRSLLVGTSDSPSIPVWQRSNGSFVRSLVRPADARLRVNRAEVVGRVLAARFIAPLERHLQGTRRWTIVPDAALATLPFEALPYRRRPLIASVTVDYVQSLSVLASMAARPATGGVQDTLFAMGAPDFGADDAAPDPHSPAMRWPPLPGAEREIAQVAALFGDERRVVAVGKDASEQALRDFNASGVLASARYLLFATHATLDTAVPARSALVLSQSRLAPGTDGYVTVAKWPSYRLRSDLVVLSACETGLGRNVQGEGVMGLPYALFVAGNRATLLTLWRMDDDATVAFVSRFFQRLRRDADASSALAATKREFLARSPSLWAAFVLYGR